MSNMYTFVISTFYYNFYIVLTAVSHWQMSTVCGAWSLVLWRQGTVASTSRGWWEHRPTSTCLTADVYRDWSWRLVHLQQDFSQLPSGKIFYWQTLVTIFRVFIEVCLILLSYVMLSVCGEGKEIDYAVCTYVNNCSWHCWLGDRKGIWPVKTLHQNPIAMVVDIINGWSTGWSTLWQPYLPVKATEGQLAYLGSPGK